VWDAGVGIVERGSWAVKDAVEAQPWLAEGPIPTQVDWRLDVYQRVSHRPLQAVGIEALAQPEAQVAA
jgi:hypothetical protein